MENLVRKTMSANNEIWAQVSRTLFESTKMDDEMIAVTLKSIDSFGITQDMIVMLDQVLNS